MPPRWLSPLGLLLRPFRRRRPRPDPITPARAKLRAWYLFSERAIDSSNARVSVRLAAAGVDLSRFDLCLVTWEDYHRGVAAAVLPDSDGMPLPYVLAGLALEHAERPMPTRVAARAWLGRAEQEWYLRGLALKGGNG